MLRHERQSEFSKALWVPLLWLFVSASRGRISPERITDLEIYHGNPTLRIIFSILILLGIIILFKRRTNWQAVIQHNKWVALLFLFMGLSILWSAYPWISFKRWVKTIGVLVMVLLILTEPDPLKAFSALIRRFCYLAIPLSFVLIFFVPSLGRKFLPDGTVLWVGIATHKNTFGLIALISSFYFTWCLFCRGRAKKSFGDLAFLAVSLFLLVGCGSITSLFGYFAVIATLFLTRLGRGVPRHIGPKIAYLVALVFASYLIVEVVTVQNSIALLTVELFGRDTTFTGRVDLWDDVWNIAIQRPLLGHGFGGFWVGDMTNKLWEAHEWHPIDSHNGYLDVFAEMGIVGVILVVILIVSGYRRISRGFATDFQFARLRMVLFIMVLVHNLNETSLCNLNHPYWLLFLFAAMTLPRDIAAINSATSIAERQEPVDKRGGERSHPSGGRKTPQETARQASQAEREAGSAAEE